MDPRVAEDGVTVADLQEQFEHNMRMRDLVSDANRLGGRLRAAQQRLSNATGTAADSAKRVDTIASRFFSETVRYGRPGLQAHITYLAGLTANADMKVGRDALARYVVLRRELDELRAELARILGPAN